MTDRPNHRHGLVMCSCGTVVYDCGCRLKLVGAVERCDACREACGQLRAEGKRTLGDAFELHLEQGRD